LKKKLLKLQQQQLQLQLQLQQLLPLHQRQVQLKSFNTIVIINNNNNKMITITMILKTRVNIVSVKHNESLLKSFVVPIMSLLHTVLKHQTILMTHQLTNLYSLLIMFALHATLTLFTKASLHLL
jgi:hypothetical protein